MPGLLRRRVRGKESDLIPKEIYKTTPFSKLIWLHLKTRGPLTAEEVRRELKCSSRAMQHLQTLVKLGVVNAVHVAARSDGVAVKLPTKYHVPGSLDLQFILPAALGNTKRHRSRQLIWLWLECHADPKRKITRKVVKDLGLSRQVVVEGLNWYRKLYPSQVEEQNVTLCTV